MATNLISALGAGSGIDVKALAESLVEAERAPRKEIIDSKIAKSESKISGYGAITFALTTLKTAFEKLNDASDFNAVTTSNSQPGIFGVSTDSNAKAGRLSVEVTQLANAQTTTSNSSFAASNSTLNSGAAFGLYLSTNGGPETQINVNTTTPDGIVAAINGANLGVSAELIQTNTDEFKIVVTGQVGANQAFNLRSDDGNGNPVANVSFSTNLQTASDAIFKVNGLNVTRSTNTIRDVVDGVTFELYDTNTGNPATVGLVQNTSSIKSSIQELVSAYNDFEKTMSILVDRKSEVEQYGGALAGDSLVSSIRNKIRSLISDNSSTPGDEVKAARHVGISFDRFGKMTLDEAKLDSTLSSNFADVVTMFSADTNNKSLFSPTGAGLAGDSVREIDEMLRFSGLLVEQTGNVTAQIEDYKEDLQKLEDRMQKLMSRYVEQFSVMESVVGNSKSMRTSLTSSFEGMMNAYK